jgi:hypothetical protein
MALAHSAGALRGLPVMYCVGITIFEAIFCLGKFIYVTPFYQIQMTLTGMIWRMDPFLMPRVFCIGKAHSFFDR